MDNPHRLLKRQLKRFFDDPSLVPENCQAFIAAVNDAYWQADDDRIRLERSLELSSQELLQANSRMQTLLHTVEAQVAERTAELSQMNAELQMTLEELQQTQAQLIQTEKMSSLGQLVAGVAHEINNPVSFIFGNLTYLEQYTHTLLHLIQLYQKYYPEPTAEIQMALEESDIQFLMHDSPKLLSSMKVGTERIKQIVLSLRNFSRMDEADMKQVDLHEGIESALLILQNRLKFGSKHQDIAVHKRYGNLPPVLCYAGQINQVFMNILTNAIDALEERYKAFFWEEVREEISRSVTCNNTAVKKAYASELPLPTITIQTEVVNSNWISIRIVDNGPGIPEHFQSKLFDPFFTTKPIGKGTGLGLSISYQIITKGHGGYLTCHSTVGKGTEFLIEIPIQQPKKPIPFAQCSLERR